MKRLVQSRLVVVALAVLGALAIAIPATALGTRMLVEDDPNEGTAQEAEDLVRRQEIRAWLLTQASSMLLASEYQDWRETDFDGPPCDADTLSSVRDVEARSVLRSSCERMDSVQSEHTLECAGTSDCTVPYEARAEIDGVIHILNRSAQQDAEDR